MNCIKRLLFCSLLFAVCQNGFCQDVLARQAPIDKKMKSVEVIDIKNKMDNKVNNLKILNYKIIEDNDKKYWMRYKYQKGKDIIQVDTIYDYYYRCGIKTEEVVNSSNRKSYSKNKLNKKQEDFLKWEKKFLERLSNFGIEYFKAISK